jgi:cadmium resistance protein CadD (predicted permease)
MGYGAAAVAVLILSLLGGLAGGLIDPALVGYLGILPLLLGGYLLYKALFPDSAGGREQADAAIDPGAAGGVSTFTLMVSNSGDSVAVFLPLFAESDRDGIMLEVATYLALVLLLATAARFAAGRRAIAGVLERYGPIIVPFLMMGVGVYILLDTAFDTLRQSAGSVSAAVELS